MNDRKVDWTIIAWLVLLLGPYIALGRKLGWLHPVSLVALVLGVCAHFPGCVFATFAIWWEELGQLDHP